MPDGQPRFTKPMRRIQARLGRPLADELNERYDKGETFKEIGAALGVSEASISRYFERLGIEARFPGQRVSL